MDHIYLSQLDSTTSDKQINLPKTDSTPVTTTEKLVREDVRKLDDNIEEIKKLRDQLKKNK